VNKPRFVGYSSVYYGKDGQWHLLGLGRFRATREAADYDTARWQHHGYDTAKTVEVWFPKKRRWTLTDVWNQVIVWASWVRS
jgi:hypothetical protein